jgi:hypothetical protein
VHAVAHEAEPPLAELAAQAEQGVRVADQVRGVLERGVHVGFAVAHGHGPIQHEQPAVERDVAVPGVVVGREHGEARAGERHGEQDSGAALRHLIGSLRQVVGLHGARRRFRQAGRAAGP